MSAIKGRWILLLAVLVGGCGRSEGDIDAWPEVEADYDFARPDLQIELPNELAEISGLAVLPDGLLGAVQDEEGSLFVLDPETGDVLDRRIFAGDGDYEALATASGRLYVLESDGTLYRMDGWRGEHLSGTEHSLDLPGGCDAESLRYVPAANHLVVGCKEEPGPGREVVKAFFTYDLEGNPVGVRPAFILDPRAFTASIADHPVNDAVRSVLSERIDLSGFKPSDLAVHPITEEFYVLSSGRAAIIALKSDGTVTGAWPLPEDLFPQPEGLDFLPNGDLFISSEAGNGNGGRLVRYTYASNRPTSTE